MLSMKTPPHRIRQTETSGQQRIPTANGAHAASPGHGLRPLAQARSRKTAAKAPPNLDGASPAKMQQMLHELLGHQIELEMQNEELRHSQGELEVAHALYADLYDLAPIGYVTLSESGVILQANLTAASLLGAPRNVIVKQSIFKFILKDDQDVFYLHRKQLFESGAAQECELRMVTQDGTGFWARIEATARQGPDGTPIGHVVLNDITAPKRIEESLRIKSLVFEASLAANSIADLDGVITKVNAAFLRIWGYTSRDEVVGKPITHFIHDQTEALTILEALNTKDHWEGDYTARRKDDSTFIAHSLATILRDQKGKVIGYQSAVVDITEQKRTTEALRLSEEKQRQSLHEKESLLKEIHHRVKNNLQIITSLLRLQSSQIDHPIAKAALQDVQCRVQSIALIHDHLYRSENLAQVDMSAYLTKLCQQLCHTQALSPGAVSLHLDLTPCRLQINEAIPCGLLVNELISNSFKHAFPNGRGGEVRVELQPVADGPEMRLRVMDNGVGLPPDFDLQALSSLGLRLAPDLARQLGGRLDVGGGPGAVFEVIFNANDSGFHPHPSHA